MSPNKLTKSFFTSKKTEYCPECVQYDGHLIKNIIIYGNVPFNESYVLALEWHHDKNIFILDEKYGNKSPDDYFVLDKKSYKISSIQDLQNICSHLNKIGYQITEVRLSRECSSQYGWTTSCFRHMIDLAWFGNTKTFLVEDEYVKFPDYLINYDYTKNNSSIVDRKTLKHQAYDFDYILNINLMKYSDLKNTIKQTLLLLG